MSVTTIKGRGPTSPTTFFGAPIRELGLVNRNVSYKSQFSHHDMSYATLRIPSS